MALVGAARLSELCLVTRSRRGCRRRSGRPRPARPRSAGTGLWQVRSRPRAPGRQPTDAAISAPVFSSCRRRRSTSASSRPRRGTGRRPCRRPRRRPRPRAPRRARRAGSPRCSLEREAQRLGEQPVAGEDRHVLAEGHVAGGLAAAQLVVVHRGQVVVDQRVGVDHLDRGGERQHLAGGRGRAPRRWRARAPAGSACRRPAASSASPPRGAAVRGARPRSAGPRGRRRPAAAARPGRRRRATRQSRRSWPSSRPRRARALRVELGAEPRGQLGAALDERRRPRRRRARPSAAARPRPPARPRAPRAVGALTSRPPPRAAPRPGCR